MKGITNKKCFKNVGPLLKWIPWFPRKPERTQYTVYFPLQRLCDNVNSITNSTRMNGCQIFLQDIIKKHLNAKMKVTLGWLQRYLQSSPIYWNTVTLCFLQSFQNWEAENFFFKTHVAPVKQQTMSPLNVLQLISISI